MQAVEWFTWWVAGLALWPQPTWAQGQGYPSPQRLWSWGTQPSAAPGCSSHGGATLP